MDDLNSFDRLAGVDLYLWFRVVLVGLAVVVAGATAAALVLL